MQPQNSVGGEIRRLRTEAGMTREELSGRIGMREAHLAAIEDDREEPSAAALRRIVLELEPAGTSYDRIAGLLAAPEFDPSVVSAHSGPARTGTPTLPGDDQGARQQQLAELDGVATIGSEELQFDRVITESTPSALPSNPTVTCTACLTSIETEYYDVNGKVFCSGCRTAVESAVETPTGLMPLIIAGVFGLGAGVLGAVVYYAVIAIAHIEVGIIAILIGYMVGYAVRKGARGRGGLRFQVLAVALTYASVAFAYTPLVVKQMVDAGRKAQKSPTSGDGQGADTAVRERTATTTPSGGTSLMGLVFLSVFIAALPVMVVLGSFPSGLISAFIIFVGMRQAWRMTASPRVQILGPYRVGAAPVSTTA